MFLPLLTLTLLATSLHAADTAGASHPITLVDMSLSTTQSEASASLHSPETQTQGEARHWRILPVMSQKMTVGPVARWFDKLMALNFTETNEHIPLYEQGAPYKVFMIDSLDDQLVVSTITFMGSGNIWRRQQHPVSELVDSELMSLIRQTTGVQDPYGTIERHNKDFYTYAKLLQSNATLAEQPKNSRDLALALARPFIFVSDSVSDEMLINALKKIAPDEVFNHVKLLTVPCNPEHRAITPTNEEAWRVLPVLSEKLQTSVGTFTRFVNRVTSLSLRDTNKNMPLYELGAPHKVFIIDYINKKPYVLMITFIGAGEIWKLQPYAISEAVDAELVRYIRQTTGVQEPYGRISSHNIAQSLYQKILEADAILEYKPQECREVKLALARPCIFISPRVSDEMLINMLDGISWNEVFKLAGRDTTVVTINDEGHKETILSPEYDSDVVEQYHAAYKKWHRHTESILEIILSEPKNHTGSILCIS